MKQAMYLLIFMSLITACSGGGATSSPVLATSTPSLTTPDSPTASPELVEAPASATVPALTEDAFARIGITLPAPQCNALLQPQTEGPYYLPGSPERNSLLEEGMEGTRLILAGYVLDQNCQPLSNAWLDFWQADTSGEYDNQGYRLRGHQYTDDQGRYYLETILPGLYLSRPIEHIHVKVRPEGGQEITSQLYFPNQPVNGLTVTLEERGDTQIGYFNFVIPR